ncbi:MAG: DUF5818 domain-containing protein [Acidobacteriota bacterium]
MKKLMNSLKHELSLFAAATLFVVVCALAWGSPFVGNASAAGTVFANTNTSAQLHTEIFRGTVVRNGTQFLLRDSSGQVFRLDNALQAQSYVGKTVTVTGQIDAATDVIRLQRIAAHGA